MWFLFIVLASEIYTCIKITCFTVFQGWFFINVISTAALSLILPKSVPEIFIAHLTTVSGSITHPLKKAVDIQRVQNYSDEFSITYCELHRKTEVWEERGKVPPSFYPQADRIHPLCAALLPLFCPSNFTEAGRVNACKH